MVNDNVYKAEQEEKGILMNIMSLVQQLLQEEGSEQQGQKEPQVEAPVQTGTELEQLKSKTMKAEDMEDEKDDDEEDVEKGIESTPSDTDHTANDDSEDRLEDVNTDITDETIAELAKSIVKSLYKKPVKKSANSNSSQIVKLLGEMAKVQKSLVSRQEETENAIGHLLNGFGIADEIKKSQAMAPSSEVRKGLNNSADLESTMAYIAKALGKDKPEEEKFTNNNEVVRKSLNNKSFLSALVTKR